KAPARRSEHELPRHFSRPSRRLMHEMGFPEWLRGEQLIELIEADIDPEGDELLRRRVGADVAARLADRTRLFLATALLQFDGMGQGPCLYFGPGSVRVVEATYFV